MIQTQRYIRKPLYVDAIRVTAANFEEIATWCQGDIQTEEIPGKGTTKKFIRVRVQNPKNPRQTKAFVGDWILYTETGYKVYTVKAFHAAFDIVETTPAPPADEPVSAAQIHEWEARDAAAIVEDPIIGDGTPPKYPEPEIVPATPEGIAQAVEDNEAARKAEEQEALATDDTKAEFVDEQPQNGKRVLSIEEQKAMTPEELKELIQEGEVVLAQDVN